MEWVSFYTGETSPSREASAMRGESADGEATLAQMFMEGVYRLLPSWEDAEGSTPSETFSEQDSEDSSSLSVLVGNWLDVHQFFLDAQLSGKAERELTAELPSVHKKLGKIYKALMTERHDILVKLEAPLRSGSRSPSLMAKTTTNMGFGFGLSSSTPSRGKMAVTEDISLLLPPCYHYLFTTQLPPEPEPEPEAEAEAAEAELEPAPNDSKPPHDLDEESHHDVYPPPVGDTFLVLLCQYAKHNYPMGSRQMILTFLAKLLHEADLPPNRLPGGGASTLSLLQLSPSHFIVPLLDMIRQISSILDPGGHRKMTPGGAVSDVAAKANDGERAAFVLFLCVLAEKMERIPDLANFFITATRSSSAHFVLLHSLLPYLAHDSGSPEWADRRDTCRFALSAVLSLAKCPDPWVRDVVGAERGILQNTLSAACTTLFTLCKVPDNEDSRTETLFLSDVFRFWSSLMLVSPGVAQALGLREALAQKLVHETVLPLLKSPDSRVYASACLILNSVLAETGVTSSEVTQLVVTAVLRTPVEKGRLLPLPPSDAVAATSSGLTAFFTFFILPHLSDSPSLTAEDVANRAALGYQLTPWTACDSTLVFLNMMATRCPYDFLREVLGLNQSFASASHRPGELVAPPPEIQIDDYFPFALQRKGKTADVRLGNDVLQRLLVIESNMPLEVLQRLQVHYNPHLGGVGCKRRDSATQRSSIASKESVWFSESVHKSGFVTSLCNLLRHFMELPVTTAVLLAQLAMSVVLLPDFRVPFTLLHPTGGRMTEALCLLRDQLERELKEEADAASAAAAEASAAPIKASSHSKKSGASWLWKTLSGLSTEGSSHKTPSSHSDPHPATSTSPPTVWSRQAVYEKYAQLDPPLDWESDSCPSGITKELHNAMMRHRNFVESATCLGIFRQELNAAIGYVEMSLQLMALQPGQPFS